MDFARSNDWQMALDKATGNIEPRIFKTQTLSRNYSG
jgi:hypothetical protein